MPVPILGTGLGPPNWQWPGIHDGNYVAYRYAEMTRKYKLVNRAPVLCRDTIEWARWYETADRMVAKTVFEQEGIVVSTVFLGLDPRGEAEIELFGPPQIFETRIIGERVDLNANVVHRVPLHHELEGYVNRASNWETAEEMHCQAIVCVKKVLGI